MEITTAFWTENFNRQIIVTWDDFIESFCNFTQKFSKIKLDELQKYHIKSIIDPNNNQQIQLNQFMEFLDSYWTIPSNRTNLFKHKFSIMTNRIKNGFKQLKISILIENSIKKEVVFRKIKLIQNTSQKNLKCKEFLIIGSSNQCDFKIDNIYLNQIHFKIFDHPNGYKIKDVSKSNRLKLKVQKLLLLKIGMIIQVGDHQIEIVSLINNEIVEGKAGFLDLNMQIKNLEQIFEQQKQEKVLKNEYQQIQQQEPLDYDTRILLKIIIRNIKSHQQKEYEIKKNTKFGNSNKSNIVIKDIKVKHQSFSLEYTSDNWFLNPKQQFVSVYLCNKVQRQNCLNSNSYLLQQNDKFIIKDCQFMFNMIDQQEQY